MHTGYFVNDITPGLFVAYRLRAVHIPAGNEGFPPEHGLHDWMSDNWSVFTNWRYALWRPAPEQVRRTRRVGDRCAGAWRGSPPWGTWGERPAGRAPERTTTDCPGSLSDLMKASCGHRHAFVSESSGCSLSSSAYPKTPPQKLDENKNILRRLRENKY